MTALSSLSTMLSYLRNPFSQKKRSTAEDVPFRVRAWEAEVFPLMHLNLKDHKLVWTKQVRMTKQELQDAMSGDMARIFIPTAAFPAESFYLHWAYSDIPSKRHWDALPEEAEFQLDARISPLISGNGRSCVIIPLFDFSDYDTLFVNSRNQ